MDEQDRFLPVVGLSLVGGASPLGDNPTILALTDRSRLNIQPIFVHTAYQIRSILVMLCLIL
jgi:hypothetical protein